MKIAHMINPYLSYEMEGRTWKLKEVIMTASLDVVCRTAKERVMLQGVSTPPPPPIFQRKIWEYSALVIIWRFHVPLHQVDIDIYHKINAPVDQKTSSESLP